MNKLTCLKGRLVLVPNPTVNWRQQHTAVFGERRHCAAPPGCWRDCLDCLETAKPLGSGEQCHNWQPCDYYNNCSWIWLLGINSYNVVIIVAQQSDWSYCCCSLSNNRINMDHPQLMKSIRDTWQQWQNQQQLTARRVSPARIGCARWETYLDCWVTSLAELFSASSAEGWEKRYGSTRKGMQNYIWYVNMNI